MRGKFCKLVAVTLILTLFWGCATTGTAPGSGGMSDSTRTKAEGTGIGALLGAGLGAGAGALIGGKEGAAIGAGVGAALGAGVGYALGSTVATRKEKYANNEDRLNGEIQIVAQYNKELRNYNRKTASRINTLDKETARLVALYKKGKVKETALREKSDKINKLIADADKIKKSKNKELVALNEYRQSLDGTKNKNNVAKLDQEVKMLRSNIAMLNDNNIQMAKLTQLLTSRN